jgi:hypothetical protein
MEQTILDRLGVKNNDHKQLKILNFQPFVPFKTWISY